MTLEEAKANLSERFGPHLLDALIDEILDVRMRVDAMQGLPPDAAKCLTSIVTAVDKLDDALQKSESRLGLWP